MKNLVFQINVPVNIENDRLTAYTYIKDMYEVSMKKAQDYANRCNADYYVVKQSDDYKPAANKHLDFQKLKMYDFKDYDGILYLDCDYIIKDAAPNIFDICEEKFSACLDTGKSVPKLAERLGIPQDRYFNAGFMYIPKSVLKKTKSSLLDKYIHNEYEFDGQGLLNKMFYDQGVELNKLDPNHWNNVSKTFALYGDHYAGRKKHRWGNVLY